MSTSFQMCRCTCYDFAFPASLHGADCMCIFKGDILFVRMVYTDAAPSVTEAQIIDEAWTGRSNMDGLFCRFPCC